MEREIGRKPKIYCGEGKTKQSFKEECDINTIVKRYRKTGQLPNMIKHNPKYGDFTSVPSYQEALDIVFTAKEQFDNLSVDVRKRFQNDPEKFLEFVNDEKNKAELKAMGLLKNIPSDAPPTEEKKENNDHK